MGEETREGRLARIPPYTSTVERSKVDVLRVAYLLVLEALPGLLPEEGQASSGTHKALAPMFALCFVTSLMVSAQFRRS